MSKYGLSVSLLFPVMKTIVHQGFSLDRFFAYASRDISLLQNPEHRISEREMDEMLEAAASFTSDPAFGLHQGELIDPGSMGILGYVLLNSGTLLEAFNSYERYNLLLCSGIHIDLDVDGGWATFAFVPQNDTQRRSRHVIEGLMSSMHRLFTHLACRPLPIDRLQFQHNEPADLQEYTRLFGVAPHFGQSTNLLRMKSDLLDSPVLLSDPLILQTFENHAREALNKLLRGSVYTDMIYKLIIQSVPGHFPDVREAAGKLHMSVRNLQLKLKQEQTTFQTILHEARKQLAIRYLSDREHSVGDVAFLLGFAEPRSFHAAFRKWTGMSPGQFRESGKVN